MYTTWYPCPPGQTRMRYDGTPDKIGMNPYLTAKLGARKKRGWGLPTGVNERYRNSAGAIDLQEYSMLFNVKQPGRLYL